MESPVLVDTVTTACGRRWGVATLNAAASLNALSLPIVSALLQQLDLWREDPEIVGVLLQASGPKAFCAGGDLKALYPALRAPAGEGEAAAAAFFTVEYTLDHAIHRYPKPLLCWAHGITMGGGVGLLAGASHRVVTPDCRLAMPEISIGLYPDVGGSWFLRHMPGRSGLFIGLTGAVLGAADVLYAGLADQVLPHADREPVVRDIAAVRWSGQAQEDRARLTGILQARALPALGAGPLQAQAREIEALMAGDTLAAKAGRLGSTQPDAWLEAACATFRKGCPTSAALTHALWQRAGGMASVTDVFRLEYNVSLACCAHADLAEGIRALLVDKDRQPRWSPASLDDIDDAWLQGFFRERKTPHPLAALGG